MHDTADAPRARPRAESCVARKVPERSQVSELNCDIFLVVIASYTCCTNTKDFMSETVSALAKQHPTIASLFGILVLGDDSSPLTSVHFKRAETSFTWLG